LIERLAVSDVVSIVHLAAPPVHASHHPAVNSSSLETHLLEGHRFELSVGVEAHHKVNDGENEPNDVHSHFVRVVFAATFKNVSVLNFQTYHAHKDYCVIQH